MGMMKDFENRFNALGLRNRKRGIELHAAPVLLTEGGCTITHLNHWQLGLHRLELTEEQQKEAAELLFSHFQIQRFNASVQIKVKGDTKHCQTFSASGTTPEAAALTAADSAVDNLTKRVKQAQTYLANLQDDLKRAEALREALRKAAVKE